MSRKKLGSNRGREPCFGNQFDSSDMGQRYRMLGQQQVQPENMSGIHLRAPMQCHRAYSNTNISIPNQFFIPTPHMWSPVLYPNYVPTPQTSTPNYFSHVASHMCSPAPNSNFVSTPQMSTLSNFSLATPHMWAQATNPNFAAHQGARSPFVCLPPHLVHPLHQNRFGLQPVLVPCHPYLMQSRPPYGRAHPVSSWQHALQNGGGIVQTDSDMPTMSAREANGIDYLAPHFHARDTPVVQTPTKGCQHDVSSLPREKYYEVTATSSSQANHADPTRNHSSMPVKAVVADMGPVASITADETANEKNRVLGLVASSQFVLQWLGGTEIRISKSPNSAATLCELPTNESVFYEWWEVTPTSSHPQSVLSSLGLEVRESWDGLNLMLEGLSKSSDETPSSPRSVLANKNLEKYSEGSDVTETSIDQVRKMVRIALGNYLDISSIMSSLLERSRTN